QATTSAARTEVSIDPRRQQLIGVRTVVVKRADLTTTIRAVGLVRYDETRLADVNLKIEGWIRDLYVDYTGQSVRKGQPLFTLYSPELLTTENEYVLALETRDQLHQSVIADARQRADALVAAASSTSIPTSTKRRTRTECDSSSRTGAAASSRDCMRMSN